MLAKLFRKLARLLWESLEVIDFDSVEKKRRKYEEYAVYVTDEKARATMLRGLVRVSSLMQAEKFVEAKSHLQVVRHAYAMARFRNRVLKYRSTFGGWISVTYLVALGAAFAIGHNIIDARAESYQDEIFLAATGGGLGGIALVILGLLGIQIKTQTSATIHRNIWYVMKPVSGSIMGLVTYLAVELTAQTLFRGAGAGTSEPGSLAINTAPMAVFFVGFLGGFFETFANKALLRAAGFAETEEEDSPKQKNTNDSTT